MFDCGLRVGNCYLEVLPGRTDVVVWVLPGVLPGVLITWCYLVAWRYRWPTLRLPAGRVARFVVAAAAGYCDRG